MGERFTLKEETRQQKTRSPIHDQGGSVLLALLITMVILSVLAAALLPTLFTSQMGQVSAGGAMKAYYLAEAGGRYALPRLGEISNGEHTFKFSSGDTFFIINKSATGFTSTGVVFEGTDLESRVTIAYSLSAGGLFDYGVFGGDEITFQGINYVDSDVGTNGDTVNKNPFTFITGDEYTSVGKDMTSKSLPAGAEGWTSITLDGSVTLENNQYRTSAIDLSWGILTIRGDVDLWVDGPANFSNSLVYFEDGASLTIYAAGDVNFANSSTHPFSTDSAESFIIYGISGCNNITFSGISFVSIGVYAPESDIYLTELANISGAVVGDTVTMTGLATLTYDDSLQSVGGSGSSTSVVQYFSND